MAVSTKPPVMCSLSLASSWLPYVFPLAYHELHKSIKLDIKTNKQVFKNSQF